MYKTIYIHHAHASEYLYIHNIKYIMILCIFDETRFAIKLTINYYHNNIVILIYI